MVRSPRAAARAHGTAVNYLYNALGQRVEKQVGSAYTEYMYNAAGQVVGTHNRTTVGERIFHLGSRPFAKHKDSKTYFIHPNHLNSTTFLTDQTGATIQKGLFGPYGEPWTSGGSWRDERFAGMEQREDESDLDPTPARMYEWRLYRWLSPDEFTGGPVDAISAKYGGPDPAPPGPLPYADILSPQSLNKYQYAYNNPLRYIDPTGHRGQCTHVSECQEGLKSSGVMVEAPPAPPPPAPTPAPAPTVQPPTGPVPPPVSGLVVAATVVVIAAEQLITRTTDTLVENAHGREVYDATVSVVVVENAHKTGARESTREKHEEGEARKSRDRGGEKGDKRPPRKRPKPQGGRQWKGPWPPKDGQPWW